MESVRESLCSSLTGTSSPAPPPDGPWGPDDERSSRPVLRAAGGVIPPADSPAEEADAEEVDAAEVDAAEVAADEPEAATPEVAAALDVGPLTALLPQAASPTAATPRPRVRSIRRLPIRVSTSKPSPWSTISSSGRTSGRPW